MQEKYLALLQQTTLFRGVDSDKLPLMLNCLSAYSKKYAKDEYVLHWGEQSATLSIVLSGSVFLIRDDYAGNREILAGVLPGQLFAETFACLQQERLNFDVIAQEATEILFLDIQKVLTICTSACEFHNRVIQNLLYLLAEQNLELSVKMGHICQRTTREKLLSYLVEQKQKHHSADFAIPFNRQQLADYLSVDRSAMCKELSRMQKEGLLSYHKNHFCLLLSAEQS